MKQAILRPSTSLPPQAQPATPSDRDVLRAIVQDLDVLGVDPEGASWALVRTTPELLQYLAEMDASIEDAEEDDFTIYPKTLELQDDDEDDGSAEDSDDDRDVEDDIIIANRRSPGRCVFSPPYNEDDEPEGAR